MKDFLPLDTPEYSNDFTEDEHYHHRIEGETSVSKSTTSANLLEQIDSEEESEENDFSENNHPYFGTGGKISFIPAQPSHSKLRTKITALFPTLIGLKKLIRDTELPQKALYLSASFNNPRFARYCMKMGAHPNLLTSEGQSALHVAVMHNNVEFVKECIRQKESLTINFNEENTHGQLLVHLALAHNPSRDIFNLLMAEGNNGQAPLAASNSLFMLMNDEQSNRTGFHTAVLISDLEEINRYITEANATDSTMDLNSTEHLSGQTVLHTAAMIGNPEVLRALLNVPAIKNDINLEITEGGRKGLTPLYIAAGYGHLEAIKMLIENGADIHQAARNGETPTAAAYHQRFFDVVTYLREQGARLPDAIQNPVNPAQSTHEDTIHETVAQAAIDLKAHYSAQDLTQALQACEQWIQSLDHTNAKVSVAIDAFNWLNTLSFVEPISNVSFKEALALIWLGLNDISQIIHSAPHAATDNKELESLINARRDLLVQHLYEIERGDNLDEVGNDNNQPASRICTGGAFNKLMHTLHGAHSKVFIMIVNNETILRKAEVICKDQFFSLPIIRQQEIAKNWTKENGFPKSLWNEIHEPVKVALSDAFKGLVKNDKLQTLIDVKVHRCIQRQLEHAIPYMNPPLAVEQMAREAQESATTSSNNYLPTLHSKKEKRKTDEMDATAKTSKKSKTSTLT